MKNKITLLIIIIELLTIIFFIGFKSGEKSVIYNQKVYTENTVIIEYKGELNAYNQKRGFIL